MKLRTLLSFVLAIAAAACGGGAHAGDVRIQCGVDLGLGREEGVRQDWGVTARVWTATVTGDTLSLSRRGPCGDECSYVEEIVLTGLALPCPRLLTARRITSESGSPAGRTRKIVEAAKGTLNIQDWSGPAGIVSGRLTAEFELTFYVRLDSLETE